MPKEEVLKNETEKAQPEVDLKKLKKPTYAVSAILSLGGMIIALVLAFVINDALDKTQVSIDSNLNSLDSLLNDFESSASSVQAEVLALNETFDHLNQSMSSIAIGINGTGNAVKSFGQTLSGLSLLGASFEGYSSNLSSAGDSLVQGADDLAKVGELTGQREKIGELTSALGNVKQDLRTQRQRISETGDAISTIIDRMKLANILVFIMFIVMFGVLLLNSTAGFL
jgi:uncharacterized protein YoxC